MLAGSFKKKKKSRSYRRGWQCGGFPIGGSACLERNTDLEMRQTSSTGTYFESDVHSIEIVGGGLECIFHCHGGLAKIGLFFVLKFGFYPLL